MSEDRVLITHGSGGALTRKLIEDTIAPVFNNEILAKFEDSSEIPGRSELVFTTDSHVVNPVFFPGGDIGRLSVSGTVNDIVTSGARPVALSVGLIIEEGFPLKELKKILTSMKKTADEVPVQIITGDTKVVERGKCDGIYINTSGVGILERGIKLSPYNIKPDDVVIISGPIGNHEASIIAARNDLLPGVKINSDCAPLYDMMKNLIDEVPDTRCARDPTRGGLATTLIELIESSGYGIEIFEEDIPVDNDVKDLCEILGMDPLFMANEGKMIIIVPKKNAENALEIIRKSKYGEKASIIGRVHDKKARLTLKTVYGSTRVITMPAGSQLPRIC